MIKMMVIAVGVLGGPVDLGKIYSYDTMEQCNERIIHYAKMFNVDVKYHVDTKGMSARHKGNALNDVVRICVEDN